MLYIIIAILVIWIIAAIRDDATVVLSNWHHLFDDAKYSTQEIYVKIEEGLRAKEINSIHMRRKDFSESGIFSSNRQYLRVNRNEVYYDICAAPFGTGFFISWWQLYRPSFFQIMMSKIPFVKDVALNMTYFQSDTETMFKETVHHVVLDVAKDISNTKGYRLTELEQLPKELRGYSK